ncbi:aldo/keto reductase [Rossellomorea aquimaris]|uniref:Aldo/keto reductase n=1 Tax=Rossellomorea aquimaris TaxID=189382 RepID=A0A5D4TNB8_9BACI|nr:aldo/keto reductase [Rossellomorea aquimaris]TYS76318.1 aldo/keto reductase [Rossellomorea aquimaris]
MEKRQLGNSELYVSKMGLGCMSLGENPDKAQHIIEAALEAGINYFDTADLYDFGENEKIVGKALQSAREDVIIATKAGNRWNDAKDNWHWDPSKEYIKEAAKNSLKRLGTDNIDLFQLHGGTIEDPADETIEAFEELQQEGIIRYYGISSIRQNVIKRFTESSNLVSVMMQYSLLDRRPEELFPLLKEKNVSVVTRGPVAKGLLSDKMLEKASEKIKENGYLDYSYQELEEVLSSIHGKLADERSMNEIALQYILSHEEVSAVVPGASSVRQVQENAKAVKSEPLAKEEIQVLKELTKQNVYEQHRI